MDPAPAGAQRFAHRMDADQHLPLVRSSRSQALPPLGASIRRRAI
jgi:hypothetical protein